MSVDKLLRIKIWSKVLLIISVVLFLIGIGVIFGPALIHESDMNQDALEYSELREETITNSVVDSTQVADEPADASMYVAGYQITFYRNSDNATLIASWMLDNAHYTIAGSVNEEEIAKIIDSMMK